MSVTENITNHTKVFIDQYGNTYKSFEKYKQAKESGRLDNAGMAGRTGEIERDKGTQEEIKK